MNMQQNLGQFHNSLKTDIVKGNHSGGIYSHSRLSSFEQCRLKFKFQYIDRIKTDIKGTIETFMGSRVHDALEKLYKDLKYKKLNTKDELVKFYYSEWEKKWDDKYLIVKKDYSVENYQAIGENAISDYYDRFSPFDQDRTIGIEQRVVIRIGKDKEYVIQGYIDRLSYDGDGVYTIHDYKTGNTLMTQEHADNDRQLALYAIGVKESYPDALKVRLMWHFVAFDKDVVSERTDDQLLHLKGEIISLIREIESANEFPPTMGILCNWCQFQPFCPNFKHKFELEQKNEFFKDDGVKLVDRYAEFCKKKDEIESQLGKVKEALFAFAKKKDMNVVQGTRKIAILKSYPKNSFPKKGDPRQQDFFDAIRKIGLWDRLATADVYELTKLINCNEIHPELVKVLDPFIEKGTTDRIYLREK